jgi:autotransporter family porin
VAACAAALLAACTLDARVAIVASPPDGSATGTGVGGAGGGAGGAGAGGGVADAGSAGALPVRFATLPAGSALPDDATCAALVRRTANEPRPANAIPNHVVPTAQQIAALAPWNSANAYDDRALGLQARITGSFTGTTDELLQWVACKWGFDEDHIRAEAVQSSAWRQTLATDFTTMSSACPPDAQTRTTDGGIECAQTYGIFQILWRYHETAWPAFRDSTPFHLDYIFGLRRVCFEGWDTSQAARATSGKAYTANDEWGCVGAHYSGGWYDDGANAYITAVMGQLAGRAWTRPGF